MWMCAYNPAALPVTITLHLAAPTTIAIIRVWVRRLRAVERRTANTRHRFQNYSESRVHALRGVRNIRIFLDETCIFFGEITCAFSDADGKPLGDVSAAERAPVAKIAARPCSRAPKSRMCARRCVSRRLIGSARCLHALCHAICFRRRHEKRRVQKHKDLRTRARAAAVRRPSPFA